MSRWTKFDWREQAPKQPPPERGIRMKKAGTTWWGQRWIAALENVLGGDASRLSRGRTYARAGRTHDLVVHGGEVSAKVTGTRATPYEVSIVVARLGDPRWQQAIEGMAKKAQFAAELLGGQMPKEIDDVFRAAGVSLFPQQRADLDTSCSCPDWGDPCKHVAATHYVLGEALDRDPFLLFELRGRTKEQVLDALRAARGGASETTAQKASRANTARREADEGAPTVKLGKLTPRTYDQPREALPKLHFHFDEPVTHAAVLRQLGAPAAWEGDTSPADALAPLVRAAAEAARRIALAEPNAAGELPTLAPKPTPKRARAPRKGAAKRRRS